MCGVHAALHVDALIRKSGRGLKGAPKGPPFDAEEELERVVGLFALIAGKEAFEVRV